MTSVSTPETVTLAIEDIKPYWRNPRRIPPEAVAAVRKSIELYGYQQPIVVDSEHVVIVGHTRLRALTEMGMTHVPVYVSDLPEDKAREYRLIDNKTSEMGQWDHTALVMELREFEAGLLEAFFPEVDLEISALRDAMVTNEDVEKATKKTLSIKEAPVIDTTKVECPACLHVFEVRTDSLPGLSRSDLIELAAAAGGGTE